MSKLSEAVKARMYELAEEIIECEAENKHLKSKGLSGDSTKICNLYDMSDSIFCAERIKSLLDELRETQRQLDGYKRLQRDSPKLRGVPNGPTN